MFEYNKTFSSFSVDDLAAAKKFYSEVLGLEVNEEGGMGMRLMLGSGHEVFIYPKSDHRSATFTVLNFVVEDIDKAVDALTEKGVEFKKDNQGDWEPDAKGIFRSDDPAMGPNIAWFKDPAGNYLAVMQ